MATERRLRLSSRVFYCALMLFSLLLGSLSARAQLKQPFVFGPNTAGPGPGILVFVRNDATGVLTPVPGSPFPSKAPVNRLALDFNGRFLFVATSANNIEMYTIDPNTGALQEVPNSPFASATTNGVVFMSTESTGQFLYVIDSVGSKPNVSAVESFQIDAVNLDLIPAAAGATDLPGLFASGATHLSGKAFYAILNQPNASGSFPANTPYFLLFDSSNGTFTFPNVLSPLSIDGISLALDPQGRNVALGTSSSVTVQQLQSDGTLGPNNLSVSLGATADSMSFDTLGRFLYLSFNAPGSPSGFQVHIYSPSSLLELANSPLPSGFPPTRSWSVDPTAPLIYADKVYQVDPQTGIPNEILSTSPVSVPVVFGLVPGSQPVSGPSALPSPAALSFGSLTTGQTSGAQTLTISSVGGQALSLNSITITGSNASDFSTTGNTCTAPGVLQPGASCSLMISFSPSAAGARSASLTITDNAAPPTLSVPLSGTGVAPGPAVTLIPGSLNFGTITQGTSAPLNVSVTNAGTATLNISSVTLGGANPGDFSSSSASCMSPIAVNSSCTIAVTFTPQASGLRSATLLISDDAPGSPQTVSLDGTGAASGTTPAITFSPAAISFSSTTQGASSAAQTLTVSNSGNATLHVSSLSLAGPNASEFTFANNCTAPVAPASSCNISLIFSPLGVGQRAANLMVSDDAPSSPQTISLSATANSAVTAGAAPGGSTSATVSAGQPAQFQLQLTPGVGFTGAVSLSCTGAPLGAMCQVPSSVAVSNGAATPFTATVTTSGPAFAPPLTPVRFPRPPLAPALPFAMLALLLVLVLDRYRRSAPAAAHTRFALAGILAVFSVAFCFAGCGGGGGSAVVAPPPPTVTVTPSGSYTITINFSANSSSGQPLQQLPPLQLTLKVN